MTTQKTAQQLVQQIEDAWNSHNANRLGSLYTPDVSLTDPAYETPLQGREALVKDAADFFVAFPDVRFETVSVMADGNRIAYEGKVSGTHKGPLSLPTGVVPATDRPLVFAGCGIIEVDSSGLIRSEHRYYDVAGQLTQLGILQ